MEAKVTWKKAMSFDGSAGSGFVVPIDTSVEQGGSNSGFRPMELILTGLTGCTALDVFSILMKKQQDVTQFEVFAEAERAPVHPRVFTRIEVHFVVTGHHIDPEAVDRAIELSSNMYCSAQAMLKGVVPIHIRRTIKEEEKTSLSS